MIGIEKDHTPPEPLNIKLLASEIAPSFVSALWPDLRSPPQRLLQLAEQHRADHRLVIPVYDLPIIPNFAGLVNPPTFSSNCVNPRK